MPVPTRYIRIDWCLPGNGGQYEELGRENTLDEAIAFTAALREDEDHDGIKLRYVEVTDITILTTGVSWSK